MQFIFHALKEKPNGLREIPLDVDRLKLSKMLWRGAAEDGTEFAFDLQHPLKHGDVFFATSDVAYVIRQESEPVLEVALNKAPAVAAKLAWSLGNLHQPLHIEDTRILVKDDKTIRLWLENLHVPFQSVLAVFQPSGHLAHEHDHHHE